MRVCFVTAFFRDLFGGLAAKCLKLMDPKGCSWGVFLKGGPTGANPS